MHARKVDSLFIADRSAGDDFAEHSGAVVFERAQFDAAVRQQYAVIGSDIFGEIRVDGGGLLGASVQGFGGDRETRARGQFTAAVDECAEADLWSLQVQQ